MPSELLPQPPAFELPAAVKGVGFLLGEPAAVIRALGSHAFEGVPERAVDKRRAEFLAGRFAALSALRLLGVDEAPGRNEDGSPRWPAEIVGSITHGANRALCLVARSGEVRGLGIDAERLLNADASMELRRRICEPRELQLMTEQLGVPEHELVSLAFSAKESLYKCLYPLVGHFMDFHAARLVGGTIRGVVGAELSGELTIELAVDWSSAFRAGQRLTALFQRGAAHVETAVLLGA